MTKPLENYMTKEHGKVILNRENEIIIELKEARNDIKILDTKMDIVTSDVSGLKTDVSKLQTDVSELKTDVSELKTDVSELKTDMGDVKSMLKELLQNSNAK